jgi:hypothetical protein
MLSSDGVYTVTRFIFGNEEKQERQGESFSASPIMISIIVRGEGKLLIVRVIISRSRPLQSAD